MKNKRKQNQAYADLLDLQQINPNYKGLASLILNVEYDLGIKQKPIDNSSKIKSSDLQKQAEKLYSNYPNGLCDNTHLRFDGAYQISKLIIEEFKKINHPIINYLQTEVNNE